MPPVHSSWASLRLKYQPEVDGLRALAVVPVVLFHARVPGFGGGYVGVDVFFVISGYLITGILTEDLNAGRFSIFNFYERRVRRIIPALMAVILATLIAGAALLLPYQLADLAHSAVNAVGFTSNIWFWRQTGYFAGATGLQPLIHTWSLAVEEQFYVLFPIGLYLLHRFRLLKIGVAVILALSLVAASILVFRMPAATFYLLPTRAWELMLGALLAVGTVSAVQSQRAREWLAFAGLAMILVPVAVYTERTLFPGLAAVPPCLGAFLIILAGRSGRTVVTDALSGTIPVRIGLISYSLYLWHWPILVFARQWSIVEPGPWAIIACIALSFLAAWASWRFVEKPFRTRGLFSR
jgi:peptidoglycan/LPS O-acetylase OafA/YrhL